MMERIRNFLKNPFAVGLSAYLCVFCIGVQTKNLQHNEILLTGLVSVCISSLWLINVNGAVRNFRCKAAYIIGASLGAMSAIPFYGFRAEASISSLTGTCRINMASREATPWRLWS